MAQSFVEAEYIVAAATTSQAIWLKKNLEDMGEKQVEPTVIYCNNKSAIAIAKNPLHFCRTKHIDIKFHFLWETNDNGEIEFKYCKTNKQLTNIFMKALPRDKYEGLCTKLGVSSKYIKEEYYN